MKASKNVIGRDLKGLRALRDEGLFAHFLLVSMEPMTREVDGIAGRRRPAMLQPTASDALRTSVTSMWAGVWVIAMGGRAERTATWGVTPQAQNTGI